MERKSKGVKRDASNTGIMIQGEKGRACVETTQKSGETQGGRGNGSTSEKREDGTIQTIANQIWSGVDRKRKRFKR